MSRALITLLFWLCSVTAVFAGQTYLLEPEKSDVGFIYSFEGADIRGSMPIKQAQIVIEFNQLSRSTVDVSVDVRRARAGLIFATEALKGRSVLDAARHPTIRFRSTAIRLSGAGRLSDGAEIDGQLTVRGVTRPVTLRAALYRQRGTTPGDLSQLSFRLSGQLSRSSFGASGYAGFVDDAIRLDITARVRKP